MPRHRTLNFTRCSGVSAVWCPIHGDCCCARSEDGDIYAMDDPDCPLHSRQSPHPIRTAVAVIDCVEIAS